MSIIVRSQEPTATPPASGHEAKDLAQVSKEQPSAPAEKAEQNESASDSETDSTEETEATEETEGSDTESEKSESENENDAEKAIDTPKKKGGFQRRIDKLNAAKAAAQQEAEYWKREALKNATGQKTDAPKTDPAKPEANAGKPDPGTFDTHAEYVEALTDWKIEQRQKVDTEKQQRANLETEQAKLAKSYTERVKSFSEKQADFAEVLSEVDDIPVSPAVREIILSSENGPEIAYELAKLGPEEFARVCTLSPLSAARKIGELEARIAAKASSETTPETKKITNAPKPLSTVKAGKGSAPKSISDPNLSQAEYERIRREQIKRRQG